MRTCEPKFRYAKIILQPGNRKNEMNEGAVNTIKRTHKLLALALALILCAAMSVTAFAADYTVVKGDSLWKIARNHLGSGRRWTEIYEANKYTIKNPSQIQVGQVLRTCSARSRRSADAPCPACRL